MAFPDRLRPGFHLVGQRGRLVRLLFRGAIHRRFTVIFSRGVFNMYRRHS